MHTSRLVFKFIRNYFIYLYILQIDIALLKQTSSTTSFGQASQSLQQTSPGEPESVAVSSTSTNDAIIQITPASPKPAKKITFERSDASSASHFAEKMANKLSALAMSSVFAPAIMSPPAPDTVEMPAWVAPDVRASRIPSTEIPDAVVKAVDLRQERINQQLPPAFACVALVPSENEADVSLPSALQFKQVIDAAPTLPVRPPPLVNTSPSVDTVMGQQEPATETQAPSQAFRSVSMALANAASVSESTTPIPGITAETSSKASTLSRSAVLKSPSGDCKSSIAFGTQPRRMSRAGRIADLIAQHG